MSVNKNKEIKSITSVCYDFFYTIRANSNIVGGPSAGAAITVLTVSVLEDLPLNKKASITGTINTGGIIGPVGSVLPKIDSASKSGIKKICREA